MVTLTLIEPRLGATDYGGEKGPGAAACDD